MFNKKCWAEIQKKKKVDWNGSKGHQVNNGPQGREIERVEASIPITRDATNDEPMNQFAKYLVPPGSAAAYTTPGASPWPGILAEDLETALWFHGSSLEGFHFGHHQRTLGEKKKPAFRLFALPRVSPHEGAVFS